MELSERVQLYNHMWMEYQSLDVAQFRRERTDTLGQEVGLFIPKLKFCAYLDAIRKGKTGDEMFMINCGMISDATGLYKTNENPAKTAAFPGFENLIGDKTTGSINNFFNRSSVSLPRNCGKYPSSNVRRDVRWNLIDPLFNGDRG
ncbi:hypothetical protein DVH05_010038 [Phytophthora capsici]|nr:hypothetical protein DVH05_010038 [Phytophthora capsici]